MAGLRRWHDDTLRKRFAEHDGEEVDHAGGGEILASAETLEGVIDVDGEDPREVTLKGITDPVRVVTVGWLRP